MHINRLTQDEKKDIKDLINAQVSIWTSKFVFVDSKDLTQEALILFQKKLKHFKRAKNVKLTTWFFRVLQNFFISYTKRESCKKKNWVGIDEIGEIAVDQPPVHEYGELVELLGEVLSPNCYRLLLLYSKYGQGVSVRIARQELGVSKRDFKYLKEELKATTRYFISYNG